MDKNKMTKEAASREDSFSTENLGGYLKDTALGAGAGAAGGAVASGGLLALPGAIAGGIAGFGNRLLSDIWYHTRSNKDRISWQAGDLEEKLGKIAGVIQKADPEVAQYLVLFGKQYKQMVDYYIRDENKVPMKEQNIFDYQQQPAPQPQQQPTTPTNPSNPAVPYDQSNSVSQNQQPMMYSQQPTASNQDIRKVLASVQQTIRQLETIGALEDADRLDNYLNILSQGYQHNVRTASIKDVAEEGMMIRAAQYVDAYQNIQGQIVNYIKNIIAQNAPINIDEITSNIYVFKMQNGIPSNFEQEKMQTVNLLRQLVPTKTPSRALEFIKSLEPWRLDPNDLTGIVGKQMGRQIEQNVATEAGEQAVKQGLMGGIKNLLTPQNIINGIKGFGVGAAVNIGGGWAWDKIGNAIMGGDQYVLRANIKDCIDILRAINKLSVDLKDDQKYALLQAGQKILTLLGQIIQSLPADNASQPQQ